MKIRSLLSRRNRQFLTMWLNVACHSPKDLRFLKSSMQSLQRGHSPLGDRQPWIVFAAQRWLSTVLNSKMRVFEYGSGGSTLYFATRVKEVVSVEHDSLWYSEVEKELKVIDTVASVSHLLIAPEPSPDEYRDPCDPASYTSCMFSNKYSGYTFEQYVRSIDDYDGFFDLVFVDGRARPSCLQHALCKVKTGGYIVLDNAERSCYARGIKLLSQLPKVEFYGPGPYNLYLWMTTVWKKE